MSVDNQRLAEIIYDYADGEDKKGYIENMLNLMERYEPERYQEYVDTHQDDLDSPLYSD